MIKVRFTCIIVLSLNQVPVFRLKMEEFENLDVEMSTEFDNEMEFEDTSEATTEATSLEVLPGFDVEAGARWIYPSNMSFRQYQYDIVNSCLFKNTLVCLPTGLGKTLIAAVVMYNFYRYTYFYIQAKYKQILLH